MCCRDVLVHVLVVVHYCAVGSPSDMAVGWEVLVTWQKVFLGNPSASPWGNPSY